MDTLKIKGNAISLVKSSLETERDIMELSLGEYKNQLKDFEKKHGMSSKKFLKKFKSGELGDKGEWFDWLFAYKAYHHVKDRLSTFKKIKLS